MNSARIQLPKENKMRGSFSYSISVLAFLCVLSIGGIAAAASSSIEGHVRDSQTGEPLPGASVFVVGTSLGASTNLDGQFTIREVPPGSYKLRATYVGYNPKEIVIDVKSGTVVKVEVKLDAVGIKGKEVVITAQASGQNSAINQQLSSVQITNVVSAAKIQELPDANAAESVGRLPGVSLIREGGEGAEVVIRGLSPQYNQVTIDGVEMASDVASANTITGTDLNGTTQSLMGDRGIDLSMISSNSLGGIEVIKAITPDMDAAVLGGVVNFDMTKAVGNTNDLVPTFRLLAQGAYNGLKNLHNDYKVALSAENRYFDNRFGIYADVSAEKRNLSDNELGVSYTLNDKTHGDAGIPDLTSMTLTDAFRIRQRYNGTLVMDYNNGATKLGLMNFLSTSGTSTTGRSETAYIFNGQRQLNYGLGGDVTNLSVMSNLLSLNTSIPFFQVDLRLSHSYSATQDPGDAVFNFVQDYGGFSGGVGPNVSKLPPASIARLIQPNDSSAWLDNITNSTQVTKEQLYQGRVDIEHDFNISDLLTAKLKFGGMYQYRDRSFAYSQRSGSLIYDGGGAVVGDFASTYPSLPQYNGSLSLAGFVYDGYNYGNFLNGDYTMAYPTNIGLMWQLVPIAINSNHGTVYQQGYRTNDLASRINNYIGIERRSAGYAMVTFNIGDKLTILPGARYQNLTTTYTGERTDVSTPSGSQYEKTVTESHGYLLPMAHLIYRPFNWFQIHFAYTNTLNYPDHSTITPRYLITTSWISYNNYQLKPATSQNYDLVFSVYSNDIGLFTIDGFSKRIKDLIFYSDIYTKNLSAYPDLPQSSGRLWELTTYINSPFPVDLYGMEVDWQTHAWYLPGPLSGLVFNVNYTHIFSQAKYPKSIYNVVYDENGNAVQNIVDTNYVDRLLNQPNDIVNLGLGYDYRGFSVRASMIYQNNVFNQPDFWLQQRVISAAFTRWDLSMKQDLPWYGLQVYLNLNNITSANDVSINEKTKYPASEQRYGSEAQMGFRVKL